MAHSESHLWYAGTDREAPARDRVMVVDEVRLDLDGMLLWVDGRRVDVTRQEFVLLTVLMTSAGRVLGREELLERAWGPERGRTSNTVSVLLSRLRRKLLRPDGTSRLRTVHGAGYVFDTSPLDPS